MMTLCLLSTTIRALHQPADSGALRDTALGVAVRFLESRWGAQVGSHLDRVIGAIDSGQYQIFFDRYARPLAYVSWARVDERMNAALLKNGPNALARAGWASGRVPWVIDLFAHEGSLPALMAYLRDDVFAQDTAVSYFRFRAQRRLAKQVGRSDRTGFARGWCSARARTGELVDNAPLLHPMGDILASRRELGRSLEALRRGSRHRDSPLWAEPGQLAALQALRPTRVYTGADGRPAGLLDWAWLTDDALRRIKTRPLQQLHRSEWNEGSQLCLWAVHASAEVLPQVLADVEAGLFPSETAVWLYRPQGPQRLQRVARGLAGIALRQWCGLSPLPTVEATA